MFMPYIIIERSSVSPVLGVPSHPLHRRECFQIWTESKRCYFSEAGALKGAPIPLRDYRYSYFWSAMFFQASYYSRRPVPARSFSPRRRQRHGRLPAGFGRHWRPASLRRARAMSLFSEWFASVVLIHCYKISVTVVRAPVGEAIKDVIE
jgi:hypothetical protein